MPLWLIIVVIGVVTVLGALLIGWLASRVPYNRKAFAVASALFLSFGFFNPGQERIAEVREDDEYSKRQRSGDPPTA